MKLGTQKRNAKELNFEERLKIEKGIQENLSFVDIAININRPVTTIKNEVHRNGARSYYSAIAAQHRAELLKKQRSAKNIAKFSQSLLNVVTTDEKFKILEEKIEAMQQHIEIILDFLKEKNDT